MNNSGITVEFEVTPAFNKGIAALIYDAGLNAKKVVAKETGEVIKTLVRLSPPTSLEKSKTKSARDIKSVFKPIPPDIFEGHKANGQLRWLYSTEQVLLGVSKTDFKPQMDLHSAARILAINRRQRGQPYTLLGHRKNQKVVQINRTVISPSTFKSLVAEIKSHFGRLRASWLVSVARGPIKLSGGNQPPQWVQKHVAKAKGTFVDGLAIPDFPRFSIISTATGIGKPGIQKIMRTALNLRGRAMQSNALLFMAGKKHLSDYAK